MEIRNHIKIGPQTAGEVDHGKATERTGSKTGGETGVARPHGDRVTLTDAAQRLLNHSETGAAAPVNQGKVDALRAAIADGSYQVDSTKIASRLVDLHNPGKA